jgi:ATP-dependent exoDNAse (exonuclease V) alpha subunit
MTINKSQGQTIHGKVGLYLPDPVFGPGQMYVAKSRCTDRDKLRTCIPNATREHLGEGMVASAEGQGRVTVNVVYDEVL